MSARKSKALMLGDILESALSRVGITKERVEKFLGKPCNCAKRKRRLNRISMWATGVLQGKRAEDIKKEIEEILGRDED